jgi:WD40 repeat protein
VSGTSNAVCFSSFEDTASLFPGRQVQNLTDHTHYVQGVSWDPRGRYLLTQSSDRSCRLYDIKKRGKGKQLATALVLRERTDDTKEVAFCFFVDFTSANVMQKLFLNESVLS